MIAVHGPGRFVGDLSMLTGQAVYVTAVAQTDVEVLEIPFDRLKEAVTQDQALGDLILRAFILRRNIHAHLGAGPPDHRLPLLSRHPPAEGLREPQSHPVPLGGPGGGSRGRGHPAGVRHPTRPDPRRDLEGPDGPAQPQQRRAGRAPRPAGGRAAARCARPAGGRRRPGRSRRCGDRGLRRTLHGRARRDRDGRAGGDLVPDRELPRLPGRHLGRRAGRPRGGPGPQVRRHLHDPRRGPVARPHRRPLRRGTDRRGPGGGARRGARDRRALPPPGRPRHGPARGPQRLLRRHRVRGTALPRRPGHGRRWRELRRAGRPVPGPERRSTSTS